MPRDYKKNCPCPHHPFGCFGHPNSCECANEEIDYAEALRMIRKHMQPGDTVGKMFMRVAKAMEAETGEVCDGCGKLLICRNCGKFRSGENAVASKCACMRGGYPLGNCAECDDPEARDAFE